MMDRMTGTSVAEQIKRMQNLVDTEPRKFRLTQKLIAQYTHNLSVRKKYKKPYNGFNPFCFQNNVELHLSLPRQIQLAKIIDRDMSDVRKEDFVIYSERG